MNLVDDVNLEAANSRCVNSLLEQRCHLSDTAVGRRVELEQVDKAPGVDLSAGSAFAAWLGGNARFAVERLGDNAGECRLAHAARAGKQIGVMQPLHLERVGQRPHDVFLTDQLGKNPGAPLAGENLGHGKSVSSE